MKKAILIFGALFAVGGAAVTFIFTATETWDFHLDPHGEIAGARFYTGMGLVAPCITVGRALGIQEGANAWLWNLLAVAVNAVLYFPVGMLVGAMVCVASKLSPCDFHFRSVIMRAVLFGPIALVWLVALALLPVSLSEDPRENLTPIAVCWLPLLLTSYFLYGLIYGRPVQSGSSGEHGASPNGGPTEPLGNSGSGGRPPSVS